MKCALCETTKHKKLYVDPSDPPMDEGECICKDCRRNALYDAIEATERDLADLKELYKEVA